MTAEPEGTGPETVATVDPEVEAVDVAAADAARRRRTIALIVLLVLLLIVGAAFAWYLITRKPLSAIPGIVSEQTPHYAYSLYGVAAPMGVAVTSDGERMYVTQQEVNAPVVVMDRAGAKLGELVPPDAKKATHQALYVAINPVSNEVYVSDRMAKAIYVYDDQGQWVRTFRPTGLADTWQPLALTFKDDGTLYVADVQEKAPAILAFDVNGAKVASFVPGPDLGPLNYPNGLVVQDDGDVLVSDSSNSRIIAFTSDGAATVLASAGLAEGDVGMPRGTAFDDSGRLLVIDTVNHHGISYRPADPPTSLETVGVWGVQGIGEGQFEYPNGLATDTRGRVYVADRVNNRVQVWTY